MRHKRKMSITVGNPATNSSFDAYLPTKGLFDSTNSNYLLDCTDNT